MYRLRKTKRVEAAHHLPNHDGKCRNPHGHSYHITVEVEGVLLQDMGAKEGMLFDYGDLGGLMKLHVEALDHKNLNEFLPIPTAENIARMLYDKMAPVVDKITGGMARVSKLVVSETPETEAEYAP